MILYLTSDPGGARDINGVTEAVDFKLENGFIANFKMDIKSVSPKGSIRKCLVIAADPEAHMANDAHAVVFLTAFTHAKIKIDAMHVCDSRHPEYSDCLSDYSILILLGGHAPTQNRFFASIELRSKIKDYPGVILGISAGSMNCADEVYMAPEETEDLNTSHSERFVPGLGLTSYRIIPHYQYLKTLTLGGKALIDEIILEDSYDHDFIGLNDGSFFRILHDDSDSTLFGEAYGISFGEIWKL